MTGVRLTKEARENEEREIILALFHPQTGHLDGCLFKGNPNLPCQCGFSRVVGHYRWALRRAKEIAAEHHGEAFDSRGPSEDDEPSVTPFRAAGNPTRGRVDRRRAQRLPPPRRAAHVLALHARGQRALRQGRGSYRCRSPRTGRPRCPQRLPSPAGARAWLRS